MPKSKPLYTHNASPYLVIKMGKNKNPKDDGNENENTDDKKARLLKGKKSKISKLFLRMESDMKRIEKIAKRIDVESLDRLDFVFSQFAEKMERVRTGFKTVSDDEEEIVDIFSAQ
jgi:hypothetical protein